ncbi:MAG: hydroxymethylbilane synthase [Candidatus Limnocylindria bacterium]
MTIVLGTRGSLLALAQARLVADRIEGGVEIRAVRTAGDHSDRPLRELGDGVFVTGLEDALRSGEIDVAVHSLKDVPTEERGDLTIAAIPQRADPRDALITGSRGGLASLRAGGVVGTSSPRREAFLRALRPDALTREIRGNVGTRLSKVAGGDYDATILACAGLRRIGVDVAEEEILDGMEWPAAPGQAALAVQCRTDDRELRSRLSLLDHEPSRLAVTAERALLRSLGGSCAIPLGAWARIDGTAIAMDAALAFPDGVVRVSVRGPDPFAVAAAAARELGQPAHA